MCLMFFRTRFQILEDAYQRREAQLREEHEYALRLLNEKLKAAEIEKNDLMASNKRRVEMIEKSKEDDLERIKNIHKKVG